MTLMRPTRLTKAFPLTAAAVGLLLSAAVMAAAGPAHAAEDDDWIDTQILRKILEGVGLRKDGQAGINYQERAPLVIPPRLELPPPEKSEGAVANNPAWPKDPDVERAKEEAARKRTATRWADEQILHDQRVLRPDELTPGATRGNAPRRAGRDDGYRAPAHGYDSQVAPSALGYKGGLFGKILGSDNEVVRFTAEPPRNQLTDPPPGYQTPSPTQPYGLAKETTNPTPKPGNYVQDHVTPTN